jgi:hypothetical protein
MTPRQDENKAKAVQRQGKARQGKADQRLQFKQRPDADDLKKTCQTKEEKANTRQSHDNHKTCAKSRIKTTHIASSEYVLKKCRILREHETRQGQAKTRQDSRRTTQTRQDTTIQGKKQSRQDKTVPKRDNTIQHNITHQNGI